jgi:hypothetical protein
MSCCTPIIKTFVSELETTIPFGSSQRSVYGQAPTVKVLYLIDGEFIESVMTAITIDSDQIKVNHGDAATGIIKVN